MFVLFVNTNIISLPPRRLQFLVALCTLFMLYLGYLFDVVSMSQMGYGFDYCDRRKASGGVVGIYPVFTFAAIIFAGMPNIDLSPATGASGT